jgi:hypothetical protein
MSLIRRKWTPEAADEWTKEDFLAIVLSVLSYFGIGVGVPLAFFHWIGGALLAVGIIAMVLMIWVIDPKLKATSEEYEKKQSQYLEELQRINRWEV